MLERERKTLNPHSPRRLIVKVQCHRRQKARNVLALLNPELNKVFNLHRKEGIRTTRDLHGPVFAIKDDTVLLAIAHTSWPACVA